MSSAVRASLMTIHDRVSRLLPVSRRTVANRTTALLKPQLQLHSEDGLGRIEHRPGEGTGAHLRFDQRALAKGYVADVIAGGSRLPEQLRIIERRLLSNPRPTESGERQSVPSAIMVTSAHPGEGKTFLALSLALLIVKDPSKQVLLLEADPIARGLRRFVMSDAKVGLLDVLADPTIDLDRAILPTEVPRLSILLSGGERHEPRDLFAGARLQAVLDEVMQRYEDRVIIIDAPPCLVSSIPMTLSFVVGHTIFVVEADRTQRPEVENALELIAPSPQISLVLNKVRVRGGDGSGYAAY